MLPGAYSRPSTGYGGGGGLSFRDDARGYRWVGDSPCRRSPRPGPLLDKLCTPASSHEQQPPRRLVVRRKKGAWAKQAKGVAPLVAGFLFLCLVGTMVFLGTTSSHHRREHARLERALAEARDDNTRVQVGSPALQRVLIRQGPRLQQHMQAVLRRPLPHPVPWQGHIWGMARPAGA